MNRHETEIFDRLTKIEQRLQEQKQEILYLRCILKDLLDLRITYTDTNKMVRSMLNQIKVEKS